MKFPSDPRALILSALDRPATARELADRLGLGIGCVRKHLSLLERDGLVWRRQVPMRYYRQGEKMVGLWQRGDVMTAFLRRAA